MLQRWRERAEDAKRDVVALYFALRDPRTPLLAKIVGGAIIAYVVSPIDLIPDFIPLIGSLDDLILVPLAIMLVQRLIPPALLEEHRAKADTVVKTLHSTRLTVGLIIFGLLVLIGGVWFFFLR
jgi:uncharacterized membrane protein YkvA (DUF1232 family)